MTVIEGTVTRSIDNRTVEIPFLIDAANENWLQRGHHTLTLGDHVELLEALRDTARELT